MCSTELERVASGDESWTVLADPEGNEFCILRSQAERDAARAAREGGGSA